MERENFDLHFFKWKWAELHSIECTCSSGIFFGIHGGTFLGICIWRQNIWNELAADSLTRRGGRTDFYLILGHLQPYYLRQLVHAISKIALSQVSNQTKLRSPKSLEIFVRNKTTGTQKARSFFRKKGLGYEMIQLRMFLFSFK